jgi:hypothetical protein
MVISTLDYFRKRALLPSERIWLHAFAKQIAEGEVWGIDVEDVSEGVLKNLRIE